MDCSPPGSSVHGILQARILEWVAIFSSRGSSQLRDQTCAFHIGRQILYHGATWKAQLGHSLNTTGKILVIMKLCIGNMGIHYVINTCVHAHTQLFIF